MSAVVVSMSRVKCDTCGAFRDALSYGATAARIEAAAEGWKFVQYDIRGKGLVKRRPNGRGHGSFSWDTVPRSWDCCPQCPLPESPIEAKAIADARKDTP